MMPSVSPFEGGICCIKSDPPSVVTAVAASSSSGWGCGGAEDEYFSMCDDLLTYSVSVQHQQNQQQSPSMMTMNGGPHQVDPAGSSLVMHGGNGGGGQPSADFMAQLLPIGNATHNNNNNNNINTATKTIPVFLERGGCVLGDPAEELEGSDAAGVSSCWAKKSPADWTESEAADWLFEAAKDAGIPEEVIVRSSFPPLRGFQLVHMSLYDFKGKFQEHGEPLFHALQRALHHHQTEQNDLLGIHNPSTGLPYPHHHQHQQHNPHNPVNNGWTMDYHHHHQGDGSGGMLGNNNNNIILPDPHQHHQHHQDVLSGYDSRPQQHLMNYNSPAYHQQQAVYGNKCYGEPIPQQMGQHGQQDGCYFSLDGIIGSDGFDYSNGTPSSDPDEITSMPSDAGSVSGTSGPAGGGNNNGHKRVGRPSGTKTTNANRRRKPDRGYGKLWEFIRDLLHNKEYCPTMIRWENVDEGVFRIVQSEKLAALWGELKHNPRMTYEKLSRAMRYYYKSKVFLPVLGRRLVYRFGPHAVYWKPDNPNFERVDHHSSP